MASRKLRSLLPYLTAAALMLLTGTACHAGFKFAISPGDSNRYGGADDQDFTGLDRNGDGVISQSEWFGSLAEFYRLDYNHDGVLTRREFMGRSRRAFPESYGTRDAFSAMDLDHNGVITPNEWTANPNDFYRLDYDRDGALSRSEFLGQTGGLDPFDDGTVSPRQWRGSQADFYRLDTDHDGVLSPDEMGEGQDNQGDGAGQVLQSILEGILNRK